MQENISPLRRINKDYTARKGTGRRAVEYDGGERHDSSIRRNDCRAGRRVCNHGYGEIEKLLAHAQFLVTHDKAKAKLTDSDARNYLALASRAVERLTWKHA